MGKLGTALKAGQVAIELGQSYQSHQNSRSGAPNPNHGHGMHGPGAGPGPTSDPHGMHAHHNWDANPDPNAAHPQSKSDLGRRVGRHAFNEGAETGKTMGKSWLKTFEVVPRLVCRGLQLLLALIVCGFYGNRVDADRKAGDGFSPEWIFAVIVAGTAALTAILFAAATPLSAIPLIGARLKLFKTYRAFPWDLVLFIVWLVVFGIFAGIFLDRDDEDPSHKGSNTAVMKAAVWIDLVNALLWLASGLYGACKTFLGVRADRVTDKVGQKLFEKKQKKNDGTTSSEEKAVYAESV